jgi:hypothetical protein
MGRAETVPVTAPSGAWTPKVQIVRLAFDRLLIHQGNAVLITKVSPGCGT